MDFHYYFDSFFYFWLSDSFSFAPNVLSSNSISSLARHHIFMSVQWNYRIRGRRSTMFNMCMLWMFRDIYFFLPLFVSHVLPKNCSFCHSNYGNFESARLRAYDLCGIQSSWLLFRWFNGCRNSFTWINQQKNIAEKEKKNLRWDNEWNAWLDGLRTNKQKNENRITGKHSMCQQANEINQIHDMYTEFMRELTNKYRPSRIRN